MPIILTDENFDKEIESADKLALVDFFATWCAPCSALAPILEKVAEDLKEKVVLFKVNVDDAPKASAKFEVEKIPTVVLFKGGQAISGFVGMSDEESIKKWIDNFSGDSEDINGIIEQFDNYAKENGFKLNPDRKIVENVINGLLANEKKHGEKYCPCRRVSGNKEEDAKNICQCIYHKDEIEKDGHCFCNLFVK